MTFALVLCGSCRRHVFADDAACPFCGAARDPGRVSSRTGATLALAAGVLLTSGAACREARGPIAEPTATGASAHEPSSLETQAAPSAQPTALAAPAATAPAETVRPDASAALVDAQARTADASAPTAHDAAAPRATARPPRPRRPRFGDTPSHPPREYSLDYGVSEMKPWDSYEQPSQKAPPDEDPSKS